MANISIKEGGTAKQFGHINKLKISNSGGGTSLWVPEDVVKTKSLYVHKNGVYEASKDEDKPYGYDEVSVNIIDECYGYDDDGNLWDIEVDDDDFLEEEELPTEIKVTTPPDKTSYIAYEPINTAGMVVTAYYGDGTEYGVIPREEYTIDPLVATISGDMYEEIIDVPSGINVPLPIALSNGLFNLKDGKVADPSARYNGYWIRFESQGAKFAGWYSIGEDTGNGYQSWGSIFIFASDNPDALAGRGSNYGGASTPQPDVTLQRLPNSYTYDGKTVYFTNLGDGGSRAAPIVVDSSVHNNGWNPNTDYYYLAWAMIYGTAHTHGVTPIKVKWIRPQDEEELTDEFEITVTNPPIPPVSGDDSGGGGSSGGSW